MSNFPNALRKMYGPTSAPRPKRKESLEQALLTLAKEASPQLRELESLRKAVEDAEERLEPLLRKRDRILSLLHGPITNEDIDQAFNSSALFQILKFRE